jgi:hypothetical protein
MAKAFGEIEASGDSETLRHWLDACHDPAFVRHNLHAASEAQAGRPTQIKVALP